MSCRSVSIGFGTWESAGIMTGAGAGRTRLGFRGFGESGVLLVESAFLGGASNASRIGHDPTLSSLLKGSVNM